MCARRVVATNFNWRLSPARRSHSPPRMLRKQAYPEIIVTISKPASAKNVPSRPKTGLAFPASIFQTLAPELGRHPPVVINYIDNIPV